MSTHHHTVETSRGLVRFQLDQEPTDEDRAALAELGEAMAQRMPTPTAEQIERQERARARTHERLERIRRGDR
jgi:hypothetical protein